MHELSPYVVRLPSSGGQDIPPSPHDPMGEPAEGPGLQHYWLVIRKHWLLIVTVFGGILLATILALMLMPWPYTATTTLLIERNVPQVLDFREALAESRGADQYDFYKTQYEILKSPVLAARVIQEQQLEADPRFTGQELDVGFVGKLWAQATGWVVAATQWIRQFFRPPRQSAETEPYSVQPKSIATYLGMLDIVPTQKTQLVNIAMSTPDPHLSATLANAHAQAYIRHGLELRIRTNEEAQIFLEERQVELKQRLEKSEEALNLYRRNNGIISLEDKENIVVERLADLNTRLTAAEAERIALEEQVHLLRARGHDSLPAVINNQLIQALKEESAQIEAQYAQLSTQLKPGHPQLDQLRAKLQKTQSLVTQEIQKVNGSIQSAYLAILAKEKQFRAAMAVQKAEALRLKDISVNYAILAREADTNRQLYDSILNRMKETGVAAELRTSNVAVIQEAELPQQPAKPKIKQSIIIAALLGLMGGIGCAFLREQLDSTLRTPQEVERYLRLPNLVVVPDFLSLDGQQQTQRQPLNATPQMSNRLFFGEAHGLTSSQPPLFVFTEAYRTLRTSILLSRTEEPPKTILFTSAIHGEGKTATAVNSAITFAQLGIKVLLIDADLRRPRCHEVLGVSNTPGLSDLLTGCRELETLAQPTDIADLFFLGSGCSPHHSAELVGSHKMRESLNMLRQHFDYVLIDAPPVIPVSDAVLLSTLVDGVVLVVDSRRTPRQLVRDAHARLNYARAKLLGMVLNRVDLQHGEYTYVYGSYEGYEGHAAGAGPRS